MKSGYYILITLIGFAIFFLFIDQPNGKLFGIKHFELMLIWIVGTPILIFFSRDER